MVDIKDEIISLATRQILKKIVANVPLFGVGIFGFFTSQVVNRIVTLVVAYSDLGLAFLKIEKEKRQEVAKFKEKSKQLAEADERGDLNEIERLEKEAIDAFRDLVRLSPR
ncbi:MAG: hypothetical protein BWZ03_00144 [bacterium ADurb.BinA186]|nr:MAG: hypothetical protein BWZ03_00144 [bacterium ADurb.BinA186]